MNNPYLQDAQSPITLVYTIFQVVFQDPTEHRQPIICESNSTRHWRGKIDTFAITIRSDKLLLISLAISIGLVSQLFAFLWDPSSKVTLISSRGWAENVR